MKEYQPNVKIPCVYMRGGTSKAVFFHAEDLPQDEAERDKVILSAFGSPDRRQIDGMGGANTSTSKWLSETLSQYDKSLRDAMNSVSTINQNLSVSIDELTDAMDKNRRH